MVSPYFEGAKFISGLGLPQFLGFGPGPGAETWRPDPNLGLAPEGPGRAEIADRFLSAGPNPRYPLYS